MAGLSINSLLQKPLATQVSGKSRFHQEACKAWGQNSSLRRKGVKLPKGDLGIGNLPPALKVTIPFHCPLKSASRQNRGVAEEVFLEPSSAVTKFITLLLQLVTPFVPREGH